jgi:ligand-binding SRPBCC domain-containing protein
VSTLRQVLRVRAPIERCFDLARSIDAHVASTAQTGERAVGGVTSGLLELGDEVTWRARHLGVWQRLTSRITAFDRPRHFRDSMVRGAFARFDHDHLFVMDPAGCGDVCVVTDVFDYDAPLGRLGRLVERVFLDGYMERFLRERNELLRRLAESDGWRQFLPQAPGRG